MVMESWILGGYTGTKTVVSLGSIFPFYYSRNLSKHQKYHVYYRSKETIENPGSLQVLDVAVDSTSPFLLRHQSCLGVFHNQGYFFGGL